MLISVLSISKDSSFAEGVSFLATSKYTKVDIITYPLCLEYHMPLTNVFFIFDMSPRRNYNLLLKAIKNLLGSELNYSHVYMV